MPPEFPSMTAYARWNLILLRGEHSGCVLGNAFRRHGSTCEATWYGRRLFRWPAFSKGMPATVMVLGRCEKNPKFNSRRGGTVWQHKKLRSSCEATTKTIKPLKQDMTHASFPYAITWQVIRQSHISLLLHTFKYIYITPLHYLRVWFVVIFNWPSV